MKVLCLSDLHFRPGEVSTALERGHLSDFMAGVRREVIETAPDTVVVTGDIVWSSQVRLLTELLRAVIPNGIPVIATLGNHEFWGRTFEETLIELKEQTVADKSIFYLDLTGAVELCGINFVGGTLFFDGSMRIRENQRVNEWDGWQDRRIREIETRYLEFNAYYVDMIRSKLKPGMATALCTHHIPHILLSGYERNHHSFYYGMKDLVHELPFDPRFCHYLICGHTHRRVHGEIMPGFMGINVGSDYGLLKTALIEI